MIRSRRDIRTMVGRQARVLSDQPIESGSAPRSHELRFRARIGVATADGTNRWKYAFVEVEKLAVGYGAWTTLSGGRTGFARNTIEDMNGSSGTLGNGVAVSSLTTTKATFSVRPCPVGALVDLFEVAVGNDTEYWFTYENGIDGACTA